MYYFRIKNIIINILNEIKQNHIQTNPMKINQFKLDYIQTNLNNIRFHEVI